MAPKFRIKGFWLQKCTIRPVKTEKIFGGTNIAPGDANKPIRGQGHLFIAVNCAKFRGTATSQKREFRGHFAAKIDNFAAISRPKL